MATLLEVDVPALEALISLLASHADEVAHMATTLTNGFQNFDGSFLSSDKANLEENFNVILRALGQSGEKALEVRQGLLNLLNLAQQAEQIKF